MKRLSALALPVALLLAGCVSSQAGLDPSLTSEIPEGADIVKVYSSEAPADFYRTLYQHLAAKGYEIAKSDKEMGTLSTAYTGIGQSTTLKVLAFIEPDGSGSLATLRGHWGVGTDMQIFAATMTGGGVDKETGERAVWKQHNRAGVAFGQMAALARSLPHSQISYESETGALKKTTPEEKGRSRGVTGL